VNWGARDGSDNRRIAGVAESTQMMRVSDAGRSRRCGLHRGRRPKALTHIGSRDRSGYMQRTGFVAELRNGNILRAPTRNPVGRQNSI
jgi:hypothetical protein